MPRPRKPAATLRTTGGLKSHPARERTEVVAHGGIGPWRPGSADPAKVWDELVDVAPRGLLTSADRAALELAARLIAAARADPDSLTAARVTAVANLLSKLGMTPAGRVALSVPTGAPDDAHDGLHRAWLQAGARDGA